MKFVIFRGHSAKPGGKARRLWYVRLVARNGQVLCTSEGYTRHPACWKFIRAVRKFGREASVQEPNGRTYQLATTTPVDPVVDRRKLHALYLKNELGRKTAKVFTAITKHVAATRGHRVGAPVE